MKTKIGQWLAYTTCLVCTSMSGCVSTRMYSGPQRSADQVAVLVRSRSGDLVVEEIDGRDAGGQMAERYEVLPGRHKLMVRLDPRNTGFIRFVAQAGHRYRLRLEIDPRGERWRGWAEDAGPRKGPDPAEVNVDSLARRCKLHQYEACVSLAAISEDGFDPRAGWDEVSAMRLYRLACNGGHTAGCLGLGTMFEEGRIQDGVDSAASLFDRACQKGDAEGCNRVALVYLKGLGVPRNEEAAGRYYRMACDGGHLTGCYNLAQLYRVKLTKHLDQAPALYEKACNAGKLIACYQLARLYHDGHPVALDEARAAALYERACTAGEPLGCNGLGRLYEEGGELPRDERRAASMYERACTAGLAEGCANLGTLHALGLGVAPDDAKASALLRKACRSGVESACGGAAILDLELEKKKLAARGERP